MSDRSLLEEVGELREGVNGLSHRVEALSTDLQKVNELKEAQQEVDRKSAEAVFEAARAISEVQALGEKVVPRDEHERKWREEQAALIALRLRIKRRGFLQALGFFIASMVVLAVAIVLVLRQSNAQHDQSKRACEDRVAISKQTVVAYQQLLSSATVSNDPLLKKFFATALNAATKGSQIQC